MDSSADGGAEIALKEIIIRAWTDADFKRRLLSSPDEVFDEYSISRSEKRVVVVENKEDTAYFVLPLTPDLSNLSEAEIGQLISDVIKAQLVLPTILAV